MDSGSQKKLTDIKKHPDISLKIEIDIKTILNDLLNHVTMNPEKEQPPTKWLAS